MKKVDKILQNMRFKQASYYISNDANVLDIGALNGEFFQYIDETLARGIGYDNANKEIIESDKYCIYPNTFPDENIKDMLFDAAVLLAVFEHIQPDIQKILVKDLRKHLKQGANVIITVPSPLVDIILPVLSFFRLIDHEEFAVHQHYGFKPHELIPLFESNGFKLHKRKHFQFGLNNLFVFTKK